MQIISCNNPDSINKSNLDISKFAGFYVPLYKRSGFLVKVQPIQKRKFYQGQIQD